MSSKRMVNPGETWHVDMDLFRLWFHFKYVTVADYWLPVDEANDLISIVLFPKVPTLGT